MGISSKIIISPLLRTFAPSILIISILSKVLSIHTLDLGFLKLEHAIAAFIVEAPDGLILIECGPASTLPQLDHALAAKGWKRADIKHLLLSHIHFDHAGAAWAFADTGTDIQVHPKGLPHLQSPEKLYNSARMIYGDQMDTLWGEMRPIAPERLHAPEHGVPINCAGIMCTPWYTPGHAVHHIAWQIGSVLFAGDVAGVKINNGPVMPPCPPPDIHIEDWQSSIQLMRQLPIDTLYLTHFGLVTDIVQHLDELEKRLLDWAAWIHPYYEQQTPPEAIIPAFQAFVKADLLENKVLESELQRYEAANPAFMSVAGLIRYWKKKNG
jgi:glyoxylase-like metal-dependent hydrolase (beta-lactamase superfamily II)